MGKSKPVAVPQQQKDIRKLVFEGLSQNGISGLGLALLYMFYGDFEAYRMAQVDFQAELKMQGQQIQVCQQNIRDTQAQLWSIITGLPRQQEPPLTAE